MKNLLFVFLVIIFISCEKRFIEKLNEKNMPHNTGLLPDDPKRVEKIKLTLSSELKNKGRLSMKDAKTGVMPSDVEISGAEILGAALPPSSFSLVTPTPGNQGQEGACVAFETTRGMRSIEEYYKTGASSYSDSVNVFSVEYVYNQVSGGACYAGTGMTTCLNLMYYQGVCLESTMPYSDVECSTQPDSNQRAEAANYRITGYNKVINTDMAAIKALLMQNHPLGIGVVADNGFLNANNNPSYIWSAATATDGAAGHGVALIGWDDSKNAYKIMNSWGTGWGDGGYGWIDYDWFANSGKIGYYCYYITGLGTPVDMPVANAGFDQTIPSTSSLTLNGTSSYDPDGSIVSYLWEYVSGPTTPTITNSTSAVATIAANTLSAGTYVLKLTVTDNVNNTASDTVTVVVTSIETINLSVSKITVKGKLSDTLTWNIALNSFPQYAEIQTISSTGINPTTLYPIVPYSPTGSYTTLITAKKPPTRYYRLQVIKSDGTISYSTTVSIK